MSTHIVNFPGADIHKTTLTSVSNVSVGENLDVTSNLTVSGNTAVSQELSVSGNTAVSQELSVSGNVEVGTANLFVDTTTGRVGVGVSQPTSRFEVAGNETLQEYPPKAMTANETYIPGHGVFRASASSLRNGHEIWHAFEKRTTIYKWPSDAGGGDTFGGTDTAYNGTNRLSSSTELGAWLKLSLPYKICLKSFSIYTSPTSEQPEDFIVYGSTDDNVWEYVFSETGAPQNSDYVTYSVNSTSYYKYFAIVITRTISSTTIGTINEWKLFGTPAPSALEDGHLTLGKALTLPRVSGHPAGAETPRAESLVVHYDTTVDSVVSGTTVVDTSGNGINGTLTNGAAYSSTDRALTFDGGSDEYINITNVGNPSGNWTHSISFWLKPQYDGSGNDVVFRLGPGQDNKAIGFYYNSTSIVYYFYGNDFGSIYTLEHKWYHITLTYNGNTRTVYINGQSTFSTTSGGGDLNLDGTDGMRIGTNTGTSAPMTGSISNFKLWGGVALTAEEVAMEYALGRTGKSINLTDTALCLGGTVPRAQLDVRGSAYFENIFMSGYVTHTLLNEAEFVWDPSSYLSYPGTGSTVYDINGNMNATITNIDYYGESWRTTASNSEIKTASNMDLRRDWTILLWHQPPGNDTNNVRIAGHGTGAGSSGLHITSATTSIMRYGMYGNDIDFGYSTGHVNRDRWRQYAFTYYHNGGVAGGVNRQVYQDERLVCDGQAGIGDGSAFTSDNNNPGGNFADDGYNPYQASPTVLRFGTTYGSGNYSIANNWFGPILFFDRVLTASEIRSLYRFYSMRFSHN